MKPRAVRARPDLDALDVGLEAVRAVHAVDLLALRPAVRLRGVPEEAAGLFGDVERAGLVVRGAALGLRADRELAHLLADGLAARRRDAPLAVEPVAAVVHEHVDAARVRRTCKGHTGSPKPVGTGSPARESLRVAGSSQ